MERVPAIIVQARNGSSRLPGKMVECKFNGKPLIEFLLERLRNELDIKIVLATTHDPQDDSLVQIAEKYTKNIFRGDANNVLCRFIDAATTFNVSDIIRVCADNPLINTSYIKMLLDVIQRNRALEYASFFVNNRPGILTHLGVFSEFVSLDALKKISNLTQDHLYHEHVTNYIYSNPNLFSIEWLETGFNLLNVNDIRLTLDTLDDYENIQTIVSKLLSGQYNDIQRIINIASSDKMVLDKMHVQIKNNEK